MILQHILGGQAYNKMDVILHLWQQGQHIIVASKSDGKNIITATHDLHI